MKYFYFRIQILLRMFLINKKNCVYRRKMSSDSEHVITLVLINKKTNNKEKEKNWKERNYLNKIIGEKQERIKCIC